MDYKLKYLSADVICSEKRGTDNVHVQISEYIFAPNGGCCLFSQKAKILTVIPMNVTTLLEPSEKGPKHVMPENIDILHAYHFGGH